MTDDGGGEDDDNEWRKISLEVLFNIYNRGAWSRWTVF